MAVYVRSGGQWVEIAPGSGRFIRVRSGNAWVDAREVYVRDGGTWKKVYQASDPQTSVFYATATQAYRSTGAKRTNVGQTLYQGYYSSSYGEHRSILAFDDAHIRSVLAGRVIKSVRLELYSLHFYRGDGNNPIGWTRTGARSTSGIPTTYSETWTYSGNYGSQHTWPGGFSGARQQHQSIPMNVALGNALRDGTVRGLTLDAHTTDQNFYCYFHGADGPSAYRPRLIITHDVV